MIDDEEFAPVWWRWINPWLYISKLSWAYRDSLRALNLYDSEVRELRKKVEKLEREKAENEEAMSVIRRAAAKLKLEERLQNTETWGRGVNFLTNDPIVQRERA